MKIGITYRYTKDPTGKRNRLYIPEEFKDIFDELGVTLIPLLSPVGLDELASICDALIIPGSYADTNPKYYKEEALKDKVYDVDEYAFDSLALEKFVKQNKPILGICGGHQEINVYFGGTLHQRIKDHHLEDLHKVNIDNNSFLYAIYQKDKLDVNSLHYQAIKDVAPGFKVVAISEDGIVEALEKDNIITVQWHPEIMKDLAFFKHFLNKIKA